ncbi:transcription factor CON7 [Entomortierella parvispora]|uniref:Transcription factor CON7 n=1 Tax=Entomortierella parvispora TaxID=205924 RepID=A0A9P3LTH2_9FUNG|nr:transcription factor CON7 [Entomortierella parvispora]
MLAVRSPLQFDIMSTTVTAQDAYSRNNTGSEETTHHQLPPLTETLHRISHDSPPLQPMQPLQTMPVVTDTMLANPNPSAPVGYYSPVPFADIPPPDSGSSVYSTQEQLSSDSQGQVTNPMMAPPQHQQSQHQHQQQQPHPNMNVNQPYGRRVTYPFVPSIDTSSGLLVTNLASPENSGSSPLIGSPFTHGGLVSVNATPVQSGMVRSSPIVGYMDAMTLHQQHSPPSHSSHLFSHNGSYTQGMHASPSHHSSPQQHSPATWLHNGELIQGDATLGADGRTSYSFVPLSGVNSKKRPRRRFDEIERLYVCNWQDCEKSYGTLNHLNAHVNMQKHGPKRHPSEFKELRKAWRRHKRAEEEAAKQAAAFHQQQSQGQLQLCDPVLSNMQPHPMALHTVSHHQPHDPPHPHPHPNHQQQHPQPQQHPAQHGQHGHIHQMHAHQQPHSLHHHPVQQHHHHHQPQGLHQHQPPQHHHHQHPLGF